jgi:hypothetical protein
MKALAGGVWHNEFGFTMADTGKRRRVYALKRTIYRVTLDADAPSTLQLAEHVFVRFGREPFESDKGTVPFVAEWLIPRDLHNPTWFMHDYACDNHGLWFASQRDGPYTFCLISSPRAHWIMGVGLTAAGFPVRGAKAWLAVRACGPRWGIETKKAPATPEGMTGAS